MGRVLLCLGVLVALGMGPAFLGCSRLDTVQRPPVEVPDSGPIDARAPADGDPPDVEDAARDAPSEHDGPSDAAVAPVLLGVMPVSLPGDAGVLPVDQTLSHLEALALGSRAVTLVERFDELVDPSGAPNETKFQSLAAIAELYRLRGRTLLFCVAIVDHELDGRPSALAGAWDSPAMLAAIDGLIDRTFETFGTELGYLSFGTEVDRYLAQVTARQRSEFVALTEHALSYARKHEKRPPELRVGVTFTSSAVASHDLVELDTLLSRSDVAIVTHYSLDSKFSAHAPETAVSELADLSAGFGADAAFSLPLVVQEVGYPSSVLVGSSTDRQRAFFDALFRMLAVRRESFPFLAVNGLVDASGASCEAEAAALGAPGDAKLVAARCSLGLEVRLAEGDRSEKPALPSVLGALAAFGAP
jgi:hypothetical protein